MNRQALLYIAFLLGSVNAALAEDEPLPANEAVATSKVPDGFRISVFASEPAIKQPIDFCIDDRGRLWVAEAYSYPVHSSEKANDRIVILEDTDGDGQHDKRTLFFEGLNYVTGIEYGFGGVWVMTPPYFYFIPDRDGDDVPDGQPKLLLDGFGTHGNAHNLANGFAWGPDGWLYGTHGRTNWSMIGKPGSTKKERQRFDGGVYRYHPIRHVWEPYADGTTNPWGIDWNDVGHAFVTNCVNPHLFQVIQGAHYEPWRGRKSSQYAYQRIDTIADHLHFTGLSNYRVGKGTAEEDAAGGGHAHCGTMIYLGDNLPDEYRNTLFTNNTHGRRINNDIPKRHGSGYLASHAADLLRSTDPWFMGVTLAYGPAGEVYVSDWSDTGECHSLKNTRRETGRIYRITYGDPRMPRIDLANQSNAELTELQLHKNDWHVRHARRLLYERMSAGADLTSTHHRLREMFEKQVSIPRKLRAMWTLFMTKGVSDEFLVRALSDDNEDIRSWAVTLLCDDKDVSANVKQRFVELAAHGNSPLVRLSLASALQRLRLSERWELATALASRREDNTDQNLPLMIWYGCEPLIEEDLSKFASLGVGSKISRVRINVARRIADSDRAAQGLDLLTHHLSRPQPVNVCRDLLAGILEGVKGKRNLHMPTNWRRAFERLSNTGDALLQDQVIRLAVVFDDREALTRLREVANDDMQAIGRRVLAIDALVSQRVDGFDEDLLRLLSNSALHGAVLRGLASYRSAKTPAAILQRYTAMSVKDRKNALLTLAARKPWANALLNAIEARKIDANELTAYCVRQIRALGDQQLNRRLAEYWGGFREMPKDKVKQIRSMRKWLTPAKLDRADLHNGKLLFAKHCASCHRLFGEGGKIGPDITGAQRNNLDYMLENIVDPNAAVARDFQMQILHTVNGRVITGLVTSETQDTIALQTVNEQLVLSKRGIEDRTESPLSIMPEGLLDALTEMQIRDLMGYLRDAQE